MRQELQQQCSFKSFTCTHRQER